MSALTCRGFGERRGTCRSRPREGGLCRKCELARVRTDKAIRAAAEAETNASRWEVLLART